MINYAIQSRERERWNYIISNISSLQLNTSLEERGNSKIYFFLRIIIIIIFSPILSDYRKSDKSIQVYVFEFFLKCVCVCLC
jgi:hypothetical protein